MAEAKAVVKIEVVDDAFKGFNKDFEKFNKAVQALPRSFKAGTSEAKGAVTALQQMTAEMSKQIEMMRKTVAHFKDQSRHAGLIEKMWKSTKEHAKDFGRHIKDATVHFSK